MKLIRISFAFIVAFAIAVFFYKSGYVPKQAYRFNRFQIEAKNDQSNPLPIDKIDQDNWPNPDTGKMKKQPLCTIQVSDSTNGKK
jgi:hypothetical protein